MLVAVAIAGAAFTISTLPAAAAVATQTCSAFGGVEVYQNEGGAHPDTWYKTFNYEVANRRPITFADLFAPGSQPLSAIFPVVQQDLAAKLGTPNPVSASAGLDPAHYQNFTITGVH